LHTLLTNLDREHVLAVMGHEMSHYLLGHMCKRLAVFSGLILVALYAVHRSFDFLMQRYPQRFGFSDLPTSLPLLVLLISGFFTIGAADSASCLAPVRTRGRPLRARDHTEQSRHGFGTRFAPRREPPPSLARSALGHLAFTPPDAPDALDDAEQVLRHALSLDVAAVADVVAKTRPRRSTAA
jgi:Peptidase family M48